MHLLAYKEHIPFRFKNMHAQYESLGEAHRLFDSMSKYINIKIIVDVHKAILVRFLSKNKNLMLSYRCAWKIWFDVMV